MLQVLEDKPSPLGQEGFIHFMKRFLPTLVQSEERHIVTGNIDVVLIAHGNIKEPFIPLESYLPIERTNCHDILTFYQPWGMKMACDGAVAIGSGSCKYPRDRLFLKVLSNGSIDVRDTDRRDGKTIPEEFNYYIRSFASGTGIKLPSIEITPFLVTDSQTSEYSDMVQKLNRMEELFPTLAVVCLWGEETGIQSASLHGITHLFQLYAHSLSSERKTIGLTVKHAGCLSDDPVLTQDLQNQLHQQYFYSPPTTVYCPDAQAEIKHDMMTCKNLPYPLQSP